LILSVRAGVAFSTDSGSSPGDPSPRIKKEKEKEKIMNNWTHRFTFSGNFRDSHTQEWAGDGYANANTGEIECAADAGDEVYDEIARQILAGETEGTVIAPADSDDGWDVEYEWEITPIVA
jgi:hypothetical protein